MVVGCNQLMPAELTVTKRWLRNCDWETEISFQAELEIVTFVCTTADSW